MYHLKNSNNLFNPLPPPLPTSLFYINDSGVTSHPPNLQGRPKAYLSTALSVLTFYYLCF